MRHYIILFYIILCYDDQFDSWDDQLCETVRPVD
eukprot:COSAG06_NODE_45300_length_356_cov_0.587549_1_plen_33_part_01